MRAAAAAVVVGVDDAAKALTDEYEASRLQRRLRRTRTPGFEAARSTAAPCLAVGAPRSARARPSSTPRSSATRRRVSKRRALAFVCPSRCSVRRRAGERGDRKRRRKKAAAAIAAAESSATQGQRDAAEAFARVVDEYCDRVGELIAATPEGTPRATTYNEDVRETTLPRLVDAVLTSPGTRACTTTSPSRGKPRAGSGAATAASGTATTSERSKSSA